MYPPSLEIFLPFLVNFTLQNSIFKFITYIYF
jgi:hypothetical protein